MGHRGGETELTSQGTFGAIGKGDIAALPGMPCGPHDQAAWLRFQAQYLAGVIDLGAGCRRMLYQRVVKSAARHHGNEWL